MHARPVRLARADARDRRASGVPAGALLAVPLLIIIRTVVSAAGKPDIAGFLFEHGTLTGPVREGHADYVAPPPQES